MQEIVQTAAGEHGGKHFYEDEDFVVSKKKTTKETIQSVSFATQKLKKDAEIKRQKEEELKEKTDQGKWLKIICFLLIING